MAAASSASGVLEMQGTVQDIEQQAPTVGAKSGKEKDNFEDEWDSTRYDITGITTWRAFVMIKGCAWDNAALWRCMALNTSVSFLVAVVTHFLPSAWLVSADKFEKLGTFLNVFVGLLLGFFLSSSMTRWYACVNAFLTLLDAVRSMQMQMIALGVSPEHTETLSRFGILSAWLLHFSLDIKDPNDPDVTAHMIERLETVRPWLMEAHEKPMLLRQKESYALLWTWVASLIGRMSQDGEIPPMATPTYGRILNIVQQAYGSIRDVRALHLIKTPFIYIHTLAILVHVNNILNAIAFGLVCGITVLTILGRGPAGDGHLANLITSFFMQFCFSMLAPMLYLALLDVSVCVAQPFTYQDAKIPAARFIVGVEEDLKNAKHIGDNPPHWDKPSFKKRE